MPGDVAEMGAARSISTFSVPVRDTGKNLGDA
jgi:hypothetical protein